VYYRTNSRQSRTSVAGSDPLGDYRGGHAVEARRFGRMLAAPFTQQVAHTVQLHALTADKRREVGPGMAGVPLEGSDLEGFYTPGFDDHVKLIFPDPVTKELRLPQMGERGMVFAAGQEKPPIRDYTPREFREQEKEMDIDFVVHGEGPACQWAMQAKEGDKLGVAGPRGSFLVSKDLDWQILIGDETAVPAMARRVKELPSNVKVQVYVLARNLLTVGAMEAPDHVTVN